MNVKFNELQSLKHTREPDCVVQLIETYFADIDLILSELFRHVENSKIDFCKMAYLAREMEDKSASIGAEHMRLACSDLIKACDEKHKKNLTRTLPWVKAEFTQTRDKLGAFVRVLLHYLTKTCSGKEHSCMNSHSSLNALGPLIA